MSPWPVGSAAGNPPKLKQLQKLKLYKLSPGDHKQGCSSDSRQPLPKHCHRSCGAAGKNWVQDSGLQVTILGQRAFSDNSSRCFTFGSSFGFCFRLGLGFGRPSGKGPCCLRVSKVSRYRVCRRGGSLTSARFRLWFYVCCLFRLRSTCESLRKGPVLFGLGPGSRSLKKVSGGGGFL